MKTADRATLFERERFVARFRSVFWR